MPRTTGPLLPRLVSWSLFAVVGALGAAASASPVPMDWGVANTGRVTLFNVPGGTEHGSKVGPWASSGSAYRNLELEVTDPMNLYAKVASNFEEASTNQYYYFQNDTDNIGFAEFKTPGVFSADIGSIQFNVQNFPVNQPNPPQEFKVELLVDGNRVFNTGSVTWNGTTGAPYYSKTKNINNIAGKSFEIVVTMNGYSELQSEGNLNVWFTTAALGETPVPGVGAVAPLVGLVMLRRRRR